MTIFELEPQAAYNLLMELNVAIPILRSEASNMKELRLGLRKQLAGLIDKDDNWINYSDDDFLRSELVKAQERLEKYDHNNPFQRGVPSAYYNLLRLFQQRCKHLNQEYSNLRGPYRTLYCSDCRIELSGLEWKPSFLKRNNIDLSVFEDKKTNE